MTDLSHDGGKALSNAEQHGEKGMSLSATNHIIVGSFIRYSVFLSVKPRS
jgi:hypothetical protein